MNFARCSLCAVGGLVFSLTCLPMNATTIRGSNGYGLPGLTLGTVGTEAMACTNDACDMYSNVPFNSYVGHTGGAGGAVAGATAEYAANGTVAPAVVDAEAYINSLSIFVDTRATGGSGGSGTTYLAFTDILTFSSTALSRAVGAYIQLELDPFVGGGGATYYGGLTLFWYGPGTTCDSLDALETDYVNQGNDCYATTSETRGLPGTALVIPDFTSADTLLVFMSLYGDASGGGMVTDPASVIIGNLPAGFSIISAGGGTYTAAVPEPASWMMTAAGVALLWIGRKRRSAKRAAAD
jgi:hypothetical protein